MHDAVRPLMFVASLLSVVVGCIDPPGVGKASDPSRASGQAPWGSATSNDELEIKLRLLNDILDGKLTGAKLAERVVNDYPSMTPPERQKALEGMTSLLEDLKRTGQEGKAVPPGPDREMAKAQLYFSERRFIEAATMLSAILDQNAIYPGARNLLARCFFFLQNRDRTIAELEFVLANPEQQKNKDEVLDALFLMGAAVAETPGMTKETLLKGKRAWETYLQLSPESPQKKHIDEGMKDIEAGLRGEGPLAQPLVPQASEGDSATPGNVMGGARSFPSAQAADGSQQKAERRMDTLKADATPRDVALAGGLDALDAKDLATAQTKLSEVTAAGTWDGPMKEAMVGLGRVAVQSGKIDDALRTFGEVIKRDADFMPAWHYNGMAHMLSGSPAEAVASWQKIVDKDPAYAQRFSLDRRIEVAKRMAK